MYWKKKTLLQVPIYLLLFLILGIGACKKEKLKVRFKTQYSVDILLESQAILNVPFFVKTPPVTSSSSGNFAANDTRVDKVEEAKLNYLTLKITDPPDEDFSFLKDIYLYISAENQNEVLLAFKENISEGATLIEMNVTNTDLAPYIKADVFTLRTKVVQDEALSEDVNLKADMEFAIVAAPLK